MEKTDLRRSYAQQPRYLATNPKVWYPNQQSPKKTNEINIEPLLDTSFTPRGAKKEITLDRCFDNLPWMYNRS